MKINPMDRGFTPSTKPPGAELGIDREIRVRTQGEKMGEADTEPVVDFMAVQWGRAPPEKIPMP
jgi:hypothetical protein